MHLQAYSVIMYLNKSCIKKIKHRFWEMLHIFFGQNFCLIFFTVVKFNELEKLFKIIKTERTIQVVILLSAVLPLAPLPALRKCRPIMRYDISDSYYARYAETSRRQATNRSRVVLYNFPSAHIAL